MDVLTKSKKLHGLNKNSNPYFKNVLIIFLFLPVLLQSTHLLIAQNDTVANYSSINGKYLASYWHDTKSIVSEPFHWKGKQWSRFAGIAGVGVITYVYDQEIYDFFQDNKTGTTENISRYLIEPWGSGIYSLPLLAGIYLTGSKNSHHRSVALTGLKAFILAGGTAVVAKHIFHRHRPYENVPPDPRRWEGPFPFTNNYTAFPSGHTTTAFAVASVLAYGYRDKTWVGITSYTLAGLVGISRIPDEKHWASDIVAAAALGSFIGITLSKINLKKVDVGPAAFHGGYGLRFSYAL